jgi:hypothetical protein
MSSADADVTRRWSTATTSKKRAATTEEVRIASN